MLADRALEWLVCIGIIPVTYEMQNKEQGGGLVPVVPIPEALAVRVTPSGALEYEARFQRSISVLSGLGGNGAVNSDAPKVLVEPGRIYSDEHRETCNSHYASRAI